MFDANDISNTPEIKLWNAVLDQAISDATWKEVNVEYWNAGYRLGEHLNYVRDRGAVYWLEKKERGCINSAEVICDNCDRSLSKIKSFLKRPPEDVIRYKRNKTRVVRKYWNGTEFCPRSNETATLNMPNIDLMTPLDEKLKNLIGKKVKQP